MGSIPIHDEFVLVLEENHSLLDLVAKFCQSNGSVPIQDVLDSQEIANLPRQQLVHGDGGNAQRLLVAQENHPGIDGINCPCGTHELVMSLRLLPENEKLDPPCLLYLPPQFGREFHTDSSKTSWLARR